MDKMIRKMDEVRWTTDMPIQRFVVKAGRPARNLRVVVVASILMTSLLSFSNVPVQGKASIPAITLQSGEPHFRVDGVQRFIFVRNLAGYLPAQYERQLALAAEAGGTILVRVQLDSMGNGYTRDGKVDETWAKNWERVFDCAAENGISFLPVFAGWFDWNNGDPDYGYSTWKSNPFNALNGGLAQSPAELFVPDSLTQKLWLRWVRLVVGRWQDRGNIAGWEVFSEVNIATGATEPLGVDFIEKAASVIRTVDTHRRPITASLAEVGEWPGFFRSNAIDFINFHPYPSSGQLDTFIIQSVGRYISNYGKPVLIGESGLSALPPDIRISTLTTAENARIGVKHAIWAAMVSGAMNGRALYWEDGFAVFFPNLSWDFIEKNNDVESPAAAFARDVDFAGFLPLNVQFSSKITGAAVGNETMAVGWFRDAGCEPPSWKLKPVISKQNVSIGVPGTASTWKIDFYSTGPEIVLLSSISVAQKRDRVKIELPDFTDDITFKMYAQN